MTQGVRERTAPTQRADSARRVRRATTVVERWGLLVVLVIVWQLVTMAAHSIYFPAPASIVAQLIQDWFLPSQTGAFSPRWMNDLLPSLGRLTLGWGISVVVAVVLGIAIGLSRTLDQYVDAPLQFLRAIPPPAIVPLFLVVLGTGAEMRVALIAFGTLWPVLLNTVEGVRDIGATRFDVASIFGVPRRARLTSIVLPAAAPKIFAGLRVSLSIAVILVVLSEMIASTDGVGHELILAQQSFDMKELWASIVVIAVIGVALNALLLTVEHRVLAWHRGSRGRDN